MAFRLQFIHQDSMYNVMTKNYEHCFKESERGRTYGPASTL